MKSANRFQHRLGQGAVVFTCKTCGRRTRTTHQPSYADLCYECWELAGMQNSVWDNGSNNYAPGTRDSLLAVITARGGDRERVKREFASLWPTGEKA